MQSNALVVKTKLLWMRLIPPGGSIKVDTRKNVRFTSRRAEHLQGAVNLRKIVGVLTDPKVRRHGEESCVVIDAVVGRVCPKACKGNAHALKIGKNACVGAVGHKGARFKNLAIDLDFCKSVYNNSFCIHA